MLALTAFLAPIFLGPSARAPGALQTCPRAACSLRSGHGVVLCGAERWCPWQGLGPVGIHGSVWFLCDISKLQMALKQVPLWCPCTCLIHGYHMLLESLHLHALHQLVRKAVKENCFITHKYPLLKQCFWVVVYNNLSKASLFPLC